jgi:hypothetical protein
MWHCGEEWVSLNTDTLKNDAPSVSSFMLVLVPVGISAAEVLLGRPSCCDVMR